MKVYEVLKFNSPTSINWRETEKAISDGVKKEFPDHLPSAQAVCAANRIAFVKRIVKKSGVKKAWEICSQERDKAKKKT